MKRIGGCPAGWFCPAACEVAAPNGKLKRRKTSNIRKSRYFRRNLLAKRTIRSPRLYMRIRLAIASGGSKPDFGVSRRPASSAMILFLPGLGEIHSYPAAGEVKIPQRYLRRRQLNRDARNCDYFFTIRINRREIRQLGLASAAVSVFDSDNIGAAGGVQMSYMTTSERQSLLSAELAVAGTRGLFAQALGRVATAFGLSHATLMHAPSPEDLLLKPLLIESSLPAAYVRDFDRANMMRGCPFGLRLRESAVPLAWHLNDAVNGQAFPAELRALMLHHAIPAGVAMPTIAVDGRRLVFWFCGERAALGQSEVNELAIIILHALDAYNAVRRNEESVHNALSARELEVVRWTAQGKTSIEIGQILTLSDHTVNAYMTNAIKKLDCVNRTQLVAKAIRLKLIN